MSRNNGKPSVFTSGRVSILILLLVLAASEAYGEADVANCSDYEASVMAMEQLMPYFPKEHYIPLELKEPTSILCKLKSKWAKIVDT